jgi:ABC-type multidrug transport system ATPase subunit
MYTLKDNVLVVKDLTVKIQEKTILNNLSFEEKDIYLNNKEAGQVIAFLGKSGSGKSTLFRALAGLIDYTGNIEVCKNGKLSEVEAGDVGYVDQKYTLLRHKTVWESCKMVLSNFISDDKIIQSKIHEILNEWDIYKCKDLYPKNLSGGQKQRLSIILQLLSSHKYLILDEPASGLDVKNVFKLKEYIKMLSYSTDNNTIIFSTHDIKLAVEMADKIYVLEEGNIIQSFDLKYLGLAWNDFSQEHIKLVNQIEKLILL